MHLSWHFVSSCLMYRGESTTANLEGLKEGLPHGRREGCNKSCFFFSVYFFCCVFLTIMLFPASLSCFWVMFCPCKNAVCSSFCLYKSSLFPLQHLSSCSAYLQACSGGGEREGEGRPGQTKDMRRNSSARNEKQMTNINMMLLWSDQDH